MRLREGEVIARTIKRHRTPYVFKILMILIFSLPAYYGLFFMAKETGGDWVLAAYALVSFFIGAIIAVISVGYLFDKVIVTSHRIIWVDWVNIIKKREITVEVLDIQDISSRANGVLAKISLFDYGFLEIKTASPDKCIVFADCPAPDELKFYIVNHIQKTRGGIHEKGV